MKPTHTPGPWAVSRFNNQIFINERRHGLVATVPIFDASDKAYVNAALLRAAPDLLAAAIFGLEQAEGMIRSELEGTSKLEEALADLEPIRVAIAKANNVKAVKARCRMKTGVTP